MKEINICLLDPSKGKGNISYFNEVAIPLFYGLKRLGYHVTIHKDFIKSNVLNIVFGANQYDNKFHPNLQGQKVIIFNLDQLGKDQPQHIINNNYKSILLNSIVFDYSSENIRTMHSWGKESNNVFHIPIGYTPEIQNPTFQNHTNKDIDVLFYGSMSKRRIEIIKNLRSQGLNIATAENVFDETRDQLIARSKIVLNISYYEDAIPEMARMSYLFANKIPVVTELFNKNRFDKELFEILQPVTSDQIFNRCKFLLNNPQEQKNLAEKCFVWFSEKNLIDDYLKHVFNKLYPINSSLTISPTTNTNTVQDFPETLHIGSGKSYTEEFVNADISGDWEPDWIVDISKPIQWGRITAMGKYGMQYVKKGMFKKIVAHEVLEHVSDLIGTMNNIKDLLEINGTVHITVPYDLSYGAWQDPTHVRAFNERSFWYYCQWHWYLGWMDERFDLVNLKFKPSEYGKKLLSRGKTPEEIINTPRAVDGIDVLMKKRKLKETDILQAQLHMKNRTTNLNQKLVKNNLQP